MNNKNSYLKLIEDSLDSESLEEIKNKIQNTKLFHGLPIEWILARQRLIANANILNNGWKVNWNEKCYDNINRSYLYASNYDTKTNTFIISETYAVFKQLEDGLIFKTRKLARQFIRENQEDLQIYFSL